MNALDKKGNLEFIDFERKCQKYGITNREKEVVKKLLQGLQVKEIADKLYLSIHTIKNHIRHIYGKCGVQNKIELANAFKE